METVPDFETAVQQLYTSNFMAPQYFVVAGPEPYQGAVITIDRASEHLPETPPIMRLSADKPMTKDGPEGQGWHLYQPNDDINGIPVDNRRYAEELRLHSATQQLVDIPWVMTELTTEP